MFRENLGLKFLSVVIALLVWLQLQLSTEHRSVINLPVSLRSVPKNITLDRLPQSIPFNVKGKGLEIIKAEFSKAKVLLDASKIQPGVDIISLTDYTIDMPENINLNLIGPVEKQDITVHADEFHQKRVPVKLSFSDKLAEQRMENQNYQITPEKVIVFGPKGKVRPISMLYTEAVSTDLVSQSEFIVKLASPGEDISISESQVRVRISNTYNTSKVLDNVPLKSSPERSFFPGAVAVKISGDSAVLENLNPASIVAIPSAEPDARGFYSLTVEAPENIQIIAVTPNKVRLK
ncbi:MAG: hypothetical protein KA984_01005 [Candidatus Cloacimonetes bacterium]|nr:hypothetical protein [Candidatus Cloacimonadota bacterium]